MVIHSDSSIKLFKHFIALHIHRPDENYAREIMQLFSIGLYQLNIDGTLKRKNKLPVSTYDNSDIQTFARAWTGFR